MIEWLQARLNRYRRHGMAGDLATSKSRTVSQWRAASLCMVSLSLNQESKIDLEISTGRSTDTIDVNPLDVRWDSGWQPPHRQSQSQDGWQAGGSSWASHEEMPQEEPQEYEVPGGSASERLPSQSRADVACDACRGREKSRCVLYANETYIFSICSGQGQMCKGTKQ